MILMCCCRYVIFSYADSGMSNTLEVEEEEEVKIILKVIVFRSLPLLCGILHCSLIIDLTWHFVWPRATLTAWSPASTAVASSTGWSGWRRQKGEKWMTFRYFENLTDLSKFWSKCLEKDIFFCRSTFWWFGKGKLPSWEKVPALTMWTRSPGVLFSSHFLLYS